MRLFMFLSVAMMLQIQGCNVNVGEDSPSSAGAKATGTSGGDAGAVGDSEVTDPPPAKDTDAKDPADEEPVALSVCVGEPFVSVWRIRPAGKTIHLPITKSSGYTRGGYDYDGSFDFTVDWGDGSDEESFTHDGKTDEEDFSVKHTYEGTGEGNEAKDYEITIKGKVGAAWGFNIEYAFYSDDEDEEKEYREKYKENANSLVEVKDLGDVGWTSLYLAFREYSRLEKFAGGCTRNVRSMYDMFSGCKKVTPDTSGWDTSNVTDMGFTFSGATSANPDVSNWDTSNVTNMHAMFWSAKNANPDVSKWDTSKVTSMDAMFWYATSANPDVSNWDTSNVTDMGTMFSDTGNANPDVSKWDTSNVTSMGRMFRNATNANPDVSDWDTSNVTYMGEMFAGTKYGSGATGANPDVSKWDFSSIEETETYYFFAGGYAETSSYIDEMFTPKNSLSTENYSTLLKKLAADPSAGGLQDGVTGVPLNVGTGVKYSADAKDARDHLVNEHKFEITDGGENMP